MDFLKSAVASAMAKGSSFPYSLGERVDVSDSIWALHNATKREDGSACSVFTFEIASNKSLLPLARNAVRKSRTLRHPGVIKVLDTIETETSIYIVTERVVPLCWHVKRRSLSEETSKWGLYTVACTLKFINGDAASVHGAVRASSVYTSESGEWKLGGFNILSSMNDDQAVIYTYGSLLPDTARYTPPEIVKGGWDAIKRNPLTAVDSYGLAILVFEVFNGNFTGEVGKTTNIPPSMHQSYKRLGTANPKLRLSPAHFVEQGKKSGGFFETPLIRLTDDIDSLGLKSDAERDEFLNELDNLSEDFPEEFFKMKVLPELLKSVEFGGGGPKVLSAILKIGGKLSQDEFNAKLTPVVVRLFGNPDRAIRVCLLDNLPIMAENLSRKVVNDKIFPQMTSGFTDAAPVVREQTVKAVLPIINKLSDRTINGELLKFLARTANDEQPGIRTNTTICLGKIAKNLGQTSRAKVLVAAFTRALRDPFVHARNAGLLALSATLEVFSEDDCATKVLPAICPALLDREKLIRDQANKTLDLYLQRVRKFGNTMADTALPAESSDALKDAARIGTSNDKSWAGWAISSFTNKLAAADGAIQPISTAEPTEEQSSASLPRPTTSTSPAPSGQPKETLRPAIQPLGRSMSAQRTSIRKEEPQPADDVYDAWGAMDDEGEDRWGNDEDPFHAPPTTTSSSSKLKASPVPYDDGGEPDFAGWLAAQSKAKKPLPKGLGNSKTTSITRIASPSSTAKPASTKVAAPARKIDTKPKDEDEDDGWGDAWD
ncbi:armadillo-type protein [Aspergillus desertorum]